MPLTTNQYNAHVVAILLQAFTAINYPDIPDEIRVAMLRLLRQIILYARINATQKEAAQRLVGDLLTAITGHAPTAAELHVVRFHWAEEAVPGSAGELV